MNFKTFLPLMLLGTSLLHGQSKPNVLFIIVDDLMKQLEVYGDSPIKTPELLKFSKEAMTFDRAYAQYPLCGPSRAALMTSRFPDNGGATYNKAGKSAMVQKNAAKFGVQTMPAYFKSQGYITVGGGKLYHNSVMPDKADTAVDFNVALSNHGHDGKKKKVKVDGKIKKMTFITEASNKGPFEHKDGLLVKQAKDWMAQHAGSGEGKPFFMCIGLKKPHSPYSCPKSFWDIYKREEMEVSSVKAPNDILSHYSLSSPDALLKVHSDTMKYDGVTLPHAKKEEMIHGYQACVSYADFLCGELLKALKENELYDNTIVVFTSDHGYKLGEYDRWAKYTLHEKDTVVPFLVRAPQHKGQFGRKTKAIVGLIDIYPSLAELCGLPIPDKIDGKSFAKTLSDPNWSERQYIRAVLPRVAKEDHSKGAGVSIIHENGYRYHHWWEGELSSFPKASDIVGYELYDHYRENQTAISTRNIYKEKPELLTQMRELALRKD